MSEKTPLYTPLEQRVSENIGELLELMTMDSDFIDYVEIRNGLVNGVEDIFGLFAMGGIFAACTGHSFDIDAQRAAYRTFGFAFQLAMLAGDDVKVELDLPEYCHKLNRVEDPVAYVQQDAQAFLVKSPVLGRYIEAFNEELDLTEDNRYSHVVTTVACAVFQLVDAAGFDAAVRRNMT